MSVTTKIIKVEDRLQEIFDYLPKVTKIGGTSPQDDFTVMFNYGDDKELLAFLKLHKEPYPLIWLIYPYTEKHIASKVKLESISLIIAVKTSSEMLNKQRMLETYSKILLPLVQNIRLVFRLANIMNIKGNKGEEYLLTKFPNYSHEETDNSGITIALWDAIKITFSCDILETCLRPITI